MKNLLLPFLLFLVLPSFGSVQPVNPVVKPPTVEQAIEVFYNSAAAYDHATTDAQMLAARSMVVGYKLPTDYNDPDFETKLETFLTTKLDIGCVGAAAICYMQYLNCIKNSSCHHTNGTICPPDPSCYFLMTQCMKAHCGGIPL